MGECVCVCACERHHDPQGVGKSWGRGAVFFQWMSLLALKWPPKLSIFLIFLMFSTLKATSSSYLL